MSSDSDLRLEGPDRAPAPFVAEEIRRGCPAGRTVTAEIVENGTRIVQETTLLEADEDGAVERFSRFADTGDPIGEPTIRSSTWHDLQAHASFPADLTEIDTDSIDLPIGRTRCLRYRVTTPSHETIYWFDGARPGMPVRVESWDGGRLVSSMTMIRDVRPEAG